MHHIRFLIVSILLLVSNPPLNAQSDLPMASEKPPFQSLKPQIYASTTESHEISPAREMLDDMIFNYETVFFETAKYNLSPEAKLILKRKAKWIKSQDSSRQIIVIGHCDQRGSESKNQYLGALRAHSVKQFLISCGIEEKRVRILSAGEKQPLDKAESKTALSKNRRVEVIVR